MSTEQPLQTASGDSKPNSGLIPTESPPQTALGDSKPNNESMPTEPPLQTTSGINSESMLTESPSQVISYPNDESMPTEPPPQTASEPNGGLMSTPSQAVLGDSKLNDEIGKHINPKAVGSPANSFLKFTAIIVLVSVIIHFLSNYEPFIETLFPPVDWPIFRNLTNTTSSLSRKLTGLDIPASSAIMEYRVTSNYLANMIERSELPPENSTKVVKYLNKLGDQTSNSGEAIEKMYTTGSWAFRELGVELRFILDNIHPDQVLTQRNTTFFAERFGKILNIVTTLRDRFQRIMDDFNELIMLLDERMYKSANGMDYVELYFEEATPVLDKTYDMDRAKQNLEYLKQLLKKVPDIQNRISHVLAELNQHRLALIEGRSQWSKLWRRKLVSLEDTERLYEMIQELKNAAKIFKEKDLENDQRIFV